MWDASTASESFLPAALWLDPEPNTVSTEGSSHVLNHALSVPTKRRCQLFARATS